MSTAITLILVLALVAYLGFAYRYGRYSPWRATWQGITLLSQKLTMAALAGFFLTDTLIAGWWPGRGIILITLLTLLAVEAWATLLGLVHVQRKHPPVPVRQGEGFVADEDLETKE